MNDVFQPFLQKFVLVFFHVILIYSQTWAENIQHLHSRITVSFSRSPSVCLLSLKCLTWATSSLSWLMTVKFQQYSSGPNWIQFSVWGCSFDLQKITESLFVIMVLWPLLWLPCSGGRNSFMWMDDASAAFEKLKLAYDLHSSSCPACFSIPFVVECDASDFGIGQVLQ